jgi:polar amino acid transport system substrate-binding protein
MGFAEDQVTWVRTGFDEAIAPGPKNFDFNLQQFSITPERTQVVSMSDPYYATNQAIVGLEDSEAANAVSIADFQGLKLGAQAGTTSFRFITDVIEPSEEPFAYNDNADAKQALDSKQIDAIVVDLPTAFYIAAVEIEGAKVIGQFPPNEDMPADEFGLVFEKGQPARRVRERRDRCAAFEWAASRRSSRSGSPTTTRRPADQPARLPSDAAAGRLAGVRSLAARSPARGVRHVAGASLGASRT